MANPFEFLRDWTRDHVNATVFDDDATAKLLAAQCLYAFNQSEVAGVPNLMKCFSKVNVVHS
jgi:hypothetical protein